MPVDVSTLGAPMWAQGRGQGCSRVLVVSCKMWIWVEHLSRDRQYAMGGTTHTHPYTAAFVITGEGMGSRAPPGVI